MTSSLVRLQASSTITSLATLHSQRSPSQFYTLIYGSSSSLPSTGLTHSTRILGFLISDSSAGIRWQRMSYASRYCLMPKYPSFFLCNITFPKFTFSIGYINIWLLILLAFNRFNPLYTYFGVLNLGFIRRNKIAKDVLCITILSDAKISFLF